MMESGETAIQRYGYEIDDIARMARVGFLFQGMSRDGMEGTREHLQFEFMRESPMGRINRAAGHDLELLNSAVEDARLLSTEEFASKYSSFGPY